MRGKHSSNKIEYNLGNFTMEYTLEEQYRYLLIVAYSECKYEVCKTELNPQNILSGKIITDNDVINATWSLLFNEWEVSIVTTAIIDKLKECKVIVEKISAANLINTRRKLLVQHVFGEADFYIMIEDLRYWITFIDLSRSA